jgi:hypothetical protein
MPRPRHAGWPHRALCLLPQQPRNRDRVAGQRELCGLKPTSCCAERLSASMRLMARSLLRSKLPIRYQQIVARSLGSIEALSDTPALKFPSSETPDVQMISVQTRLDAVARELDLDFGLVCRHQFCADRARHTSSGSGEECAIGCSARQFSVKHRCTRLFAKHCFSEHLGASRFWLTAEGKTPKG